jgi:hypothetical protein
MKKIITVLALAALAFPATASAQGRGVERAENLTERFVERNAGRLVSERDRDVRQVNVDARCQRDRDRDDRRWRERRERDRDFNCAFRATIDVLRATPTARAAQDPDDRRWRDRDRDRDRRSFRCFGQTRVEIGGGGGPEVELAWSRCERIRR